MEHLDFVLWLCLFPITVVTFDYLGTKILSEIGSDNKVVLDVETYAKIFVFYIIISIILW